MRSLVKKLTKKEREEVVTKGFLYDTIDSLREEFFNHTGAQAEHYQHLLTESMENITTLVEGVTRKIDELSDIVKNHETRITKLEVKV